MSRANRAPEKILHEPRNLPRLPSPDAPTIEWARYYLALGLTPLPVKRGEKRPALDEWKTYQTRQPTPEEIKRWDWSGGVGIVTNGLVVVDCDDGAEQLLKDRDFPPSWTVRTGNWGLHRYFKTNGQPSRNAVRILKGENRAGIDIRADGGFLIVPPTLHKVTRRPYRWLLPPGSVPLAPAPTWILEATAKREVQVQPNDSHLGSRDPGIIARARAYLAKVPPAIEGQGGDTHTLSTACKVVRGFDLDEEVAVGLLLEWNAGCQPPWGEREIRQKVTNALKYGTEPIGHLRDSERPPRMKAPEATEGESIVVQLAHIAPEAVTWTWPSRIPGGKLSLIIGDPGLGKSITCLDLAARITAGGLWPDGTRAQEGNVVLLTAEDGLADTVRPRLDALGGKPERVYVLRAIRAGGTERGLDLTADFPHLENLIVRVNAVSAFSDPVSAYLGKTDSYRDSEVRAVLAPIAAMAERTGAAVVGVMHLTKNQQRQLIHRVQGNVAFAAAARAIFAIAEDRDTADRRFFTAIKMNLARKPPSLAFRIEESGQVGVIKWEPVPVDVDAESLLGPPESEETKGAREHAIEFLREILVDGAMEAEAVKKAAKKERIKPTTLHRAKVSLGIVSRKGDFHGGWVWELPKVTNSPREREVESSSIGVG